MAIADLFRPKHKNSKLEVRAAAVAAMNNEDLELLMEVASADVDSGIRRSAIAKIENPEALATVAESQDEAKLRDYAKSLAVGMWVSKAISTEDLSEAKVCFNHAAAHGGDRAIAEIAGQAKLTIIRTQALTRLEDERALGQVVRKTQRAEEWKEALSRIDDIEILRGIAIDEKRKEVALTAMERIEDEAVLEEIIAKAKNKSIRTKTKKHLAGLQKKNKPALSQSSDEEKRVRAERAQLVREVKTLAEGSEWHFSRSLMDGHLLRWQELGGDSSDKHTKKFKKAAAQYEKNHVQFGKIATEKARQKAIRLEAEEREAQAKLVRAQPAQVSDDAPSSTQEPLEAKAQVTDSMPSHSFLAEEDKRLDNQDELEQLCERLEELLGSDKMRGFDKALKEIDRSKRKVGALPKSVSEKLSVRYQEARQKAVIHLGELREADDWKRWSTVPKMEALVKRAKELLESTENENVGQDLKTLQKEWKALGPSPRKKGDELWSVFKECCDKVYEKVKVEREQRSVVQEENLAKKEALCVRAEELKESTDWKETSEAFKTLQSEWKEIGPVPRRKSKKQWDRFRGACDAFFEARAPHLEEKHSEQEQNLEDKGAIITEIEALAGAEGDVEEQILALRELQRRWRDIGLVSYTAFEELNRAYKEGCDKVYAKREAASEAEKAAQQALVSGLEENIVECADAGWDSDADAIAEKVLGIRATYLAMDPSVEGYQELGIKVDSLIHAQLESEPAAYQGSVLDPDKSAASYQALIEKAEAALPEQKIASDESPDDMASQLRDALDKRALGGIFEQGEQRPEELVTQLQESWAKIGPVPGVAGTALKERFTEVCDQLMAMEPSPSQ